MAVVSSRLALVLAFLRSEVSRWGWNDILFTSWQWCAERKMNRMTITFVWKATPSHRPVHHTRLLEPFRPANLAKKIAKSAQKWRGVHEKGNCCSGCDCGWMWVMFEGHSIADCFICEVKHSTRTWSNVWRDGNAGGTMERLLDTCVYKCFLCGLPLCYKTVRLMYR